MDRSIVLRRLTDGRPCHAPIISAFVLEDPEPAATGCGIEGPHAPGAHRPPIDLGWDTGEDEDTADLELDEDEEFDDEDKLGRRPAESRLVSEGTDEAWGFSTDEGLGVIGRRIVQRAAEARARIFGRERFPTLIVAATLASLGLTIYFWATGHRLLALLV